mgnify:CR=1 FL=1
MKTKTSTESRTVKQLVEGYQKIRTELGKTIVGQGEVIEQILISLFAGGHCLITGAPGLAKTLLVKSISHILKLDFSRVQFTPDLMPADITGTEVLSETAKGRQLTFVPGPVFANMLLADEINRTPPKTQAALLEAMQEHQVTAAGKRHPLPEPFFVLATQNPIEQEGTYPLPEAQLDRFMFKVVVGGLDREELNEVISRTILKQPVELPTVLDGAGILRIRETLDKVVVADPLRDYAVRLVLSTHPGTEGAPDGVRQFVRWGASPRAAQALIKAARVRALGEGRAHVAFEDIAGFATEVLQHRVLLNYDGQAEDIDVAQLVSDCVASLEPTA